MLINAVQAAQLINVTRGAIHSAVRVKLLTDHKPKDASKKKHYLMVEQKDVRELGKTHIWSGYKWREKSSRDSKAISPTTVPMKLPSPAGTLSRIELKIDKLQSSVDKLLNIWS